MYAVIVHLQEHEDEKVESVLKDILSFPNIENQELTIEDLEHDLIKYMSQWDYGGESDHSPLESIDYLSIKDEYYLDYGVHIGYATLYRGTEND